MEMERFPPLSNEIFQTFLRLSTSWRPRYTSWRRLDDSGNLLIQICIPKHRIGNSTTGTTKICPHIQITEQRISKTLASHIIFIAYFVFNPLHQQKRKQFLLPVRNKVPREVRAILENTRSNDTDGQEEIRILNLSHTELKYFTFRRKGTFVDFCNFP